MTGEDDIKQPLDHLPPKSERDPAIDIDEPSYPDTVGERKDASRVSPATAADPRIGGTDRHQVDNRPSN